MSIWWARSVGAVMIIVSLLLLQIFPASLPWHYPGGEQPIIAFEFVASVDELVRLFGHDLQHSLGLLAAMDMGNRVDLLFAALYTLLLAMCAQRFLPAGKLLRLSYLLAVMVFGADVVENWALLSVSSQLQHTLQGQWPTPATLMDPSLLTWLSVATWSKWLGLAGLLLLVNRYAWSAGIVARIGLLAALTYTVVLLLALLERSWVGMMSTLIGPAFVILYMRLWLSPTHRIQDK